eukprot:3919333-Prymnesium_polylepis.1
MGGVRLSPAARRTSCFAVRRSLPLGALTLGAFAALGAPSAPLATLATLGGAGPLSTAAAPSALGDAPLSSATGSCLLRLPLRDLGFGGSGVAAAGGSSADGSSSFFFFFFGAASWAGSDFGGRFACSLR